MWAELRCVQIKHQTVEVLVSWMKAMIGRKVEDGGLLVDEEVRATLEE